MKRIVLFSTFLTGESLNKLLELIFPVEIQNKVLAYMPSDGADINNEYLDQWKQFARDYNAKFNLIDNSKTEAGEEMRKILASNILVITGGNTFTLLRNLRRSGSGKAVKDFTKKSDFVLAGFSAGAIVLTPTIEICNALDYDENIVGIKNLRGLNIVSFEVFPHYSEKWRDFLEKYERDNNVEVRKIADGDTLILDLKKET